MDYNPDLKEFMKKNEDLTVMGLFWAGYWRFLIIIFGIYAVIGIFSLLASF